MAKPLTTVSDNASMYVYFSMTENKLLDLTRRFGSKDKALAEMPDVQLILNDKSVYSSTGKSEAISGVIDRSTGTVTLRAEFPNAGGLLQSGGSGNIIVPVFIKDCMVIPRTATYELQDKVFAFTVVDVKTHSTPIDVTRVNGRTEYIVNSGLNLGVII